MPPKDKYANPELRDQIKKVRDTPCFRPSLSGH